MNPGQFIQDGKVGLVTGFPRQYHPTNAPLSYPIHLPQTLNNLRNWQRLLTESLLSKSLFKTKFFGNFRLYSDFSALFTSLHFTYTGLSTWKSAKHILRKVRSHRRGSVYGTGGTSVYVHYTAEGFRRYTSRKLPYLSTERCLCYGSNICLFK